LNKENISPNKQSPKKSLLSPTLKTYTTTMTTPSPNSKNDKRSIRRKPLRKNNNDAHKISNEYQNSTVVTSPLVESISSYTDTRNENQVNVSIAIKSSEVNDELFMENARISLEKVIDELQSELIDQVHFIEEKCKEYDLELEQGRLANESLKLELYKATEQLNINTERADSFEQKFNELQITSTLNSNLLRNDLDLSHKQVVALTESINILNGGLKDSYMKVSYLEDNMDHLMSELNTNKAELIEKNCLIESLMNEIAETRQHLVEAQAEREHLSRDLEISFSETDFLKVCVADLEDKIRTGSVPGTPMSSSFMTLTPLPSNNSIGTFRKFALS